MKSFNHFFLLLCIIAFSACDSGDIEESIYSESSNGKTIKLTARFRGINSWQGSIYSLALAGFSNDSKFAVMQRAIPTTSADGEETTMVLSNVNSDINTVELSITNSLRKRIVTLCSLDMSEYEDNLPSDTIYMDLGEMDVDVFGCMQNGIFNVACIQCHGGNGRSAAGLNLTNDMAYAQLVDVASTRKEGVYRVASGDPGNSLLHQILNEGGEDILHYNHTEVLSSQFKNNLEEVRKFIDDWILSLGN